MLKKIRLMLAKRFSLKGKRKENWGEKQLREMGKLKGKLIVM